MSHRPSPLGGSALVGYGSVAATAWLLASLAIAGSIRELPKEVRSLATQRGCSLAISSPEVLGPVAVFGFLPGRKRDSGVFWCEKRGSPPRLSLVVWQPKRAERRSPFSCRDEIEFAWSPGRLSVGPVLNLFLKDFLYLKNAEEGPDVTIPKARTIMVMNERVSDVFVCHNGDWFFRHID